MKGSDTENAFAEQVRNTLRQSEASIDELTLARLRAGRHRAVAAHQERSGFAIGDVLTLDWLRQHPLLATAMTLLLLATLWLYSTPRSREQHAIAMFEDIELLSDHDDFELFRDLDFYLWIDNDTLDG